MPGVPLAPRFGQRQALAERQGWTLDELAEAFDGYVGRLKVQVAGPWTLAASLQMTRGERAVVDPGASADLIDKLGLRPHIEFVSGVSDERIVELQRSSVRDERNAPTYTQQIRILRDELQRRVRDYDQLEHRNRNMGTRPTTIT